MEDGEQITAGLPEAETTFETEDEHDYIDYTENQPQTSEEYAARGWAYRIKHEWDKAETDFRKVLESHPEDVEVIYGLGIVLMNQSKEKDAVKQFSEAARLLDAGAMANNQVRAGMLRRQCLGYIERIEKGDWDLMSIGNAVPKSNK